MSKSIFNDFANKYYHVEYKTKTGEILKGDFKFTPEMTRREAFQADSARRNIIGSLPPGQDAPASLQAEAYMVGQLSIRVKDAPTWWVESDSGLEFSDAGVIAAVFDQLQLMEDEIRSLLNEKANESASTAKTKAEKS